MRYAIIENSKVINVVAASEEFASMQSWVLSTDAKIGDIWDGESFTTPPPAPKTREELKLEREQAVSQITVTTTAGNTFDGDEISQTRMARAIIALQATATPSVNWVLHDNSVIQATVAELSEALALAGAAQAAVWVI
jgi:hypothetical protein